MSNRCVIYGLSIEGGPYVYIGQTRTSPENRLAKHLEYAPDRTPPLYWWMRHHIDMGNAIQITVLEECDSPEQLDGAEKHWIFALRERGVVLLNQTAGGSGGMGFTKRIKEAKGSPWNDPAYRAKMNAIMQSDEYRQKLSKALKGKKHKKHKVPESHGISCTKCRREFKTIGFHNHVRSCRR